MCVFYDHYSVVTVQTMTYDIFYGLVAFANAKNLNKMSGLLLCAAFLIGQLIRFHIQALFIHWMLTHSNDEIKIDTQNQT